VRRYALSDEQWQHIADFFPGNGQRGGQWKDHRLMVDGILWVLGTGAPWRDLPERFGPWGTVYDRFRRWTCAGLWDRILDRLQARRHAAGGIDWELFCIDGSIVRAHKAAAGARKKGVPPASRTTTPWAVPAVASARKST
jgi:transposase